ncbi:N-acetylglucosamine-6-phosphate deacetylase [Geodermatophilus normandii]|uniref:Amidohydrolase family protein n=1 Tax=Geodermatophilus normandii TaxID=1137989 RepID=A0A6P0GF01_9ACTN|nr:amidohydrolase family protein [Geodermatophilus normandii]NEM05843.1 amidohydrolase family protein [Geodermatophilus normandii]
MSTLLTGARLVDAGGVTGPGWVLLDGDAITATGTGRAPAADEIVDLAGADLVPGFVDLHAHGGGGAAFDDGPGAIRTALAVHRAAGTTRSVLSLVAAPLAELEASLAGIAEVAAGDPTVLGAHLEGPFLAPARCGAHDPRHLCAPTPDVVDRLLAASRGTLRQVTVAPELPGALGAIRDLTAAGVVVAVGHTEADAALTTAAFDAGARLLTHALNAMPGLHHREPGPVGAALDDPRVVLELVLDGVHVHPVVARLLLAGAPGRIALVTDAMAAAGAGDGDHRLGNLEVRVRGGRAVVAGTQTIAGSTLTQDAALRTALAAGVDPVAAVTALTATPARALGLAGTFGRLAPGYAADVVALGPDRSVTAVWAAGHRVR